MNSKTTVNKPSQNVKKQTILIARHSGESLYFFLTAEEERSLLEAFSCYLRTGKPVMYELHDNGDLLGIVDLRQVAVIARYQSSK